MTEKKLENDVIPDIGSSIAQHGSVTFLCPNCGKTKIMRTQHERKIVAKYTCPECGFEGPN